MSRLERFPRAPVPPPILATLALLIEMRLSPITTRRRRNGNAADRNPAALLDLAARPRSVRRHGRLASLEAWGVQTRRVRAALEHHEAAASQPVSYEAARAAFHALVKAYPTRRWVLRLGMMVVERFDPPQKKRDV